MIKDELRQAVDDRARGYRWERGEERREGGDGGAGKDKGRRRAQASSVLHLVSHAWSCPLSTPLSHFIIAAPSHALPPHATHAKHHSSNHSVIARQK